MNKKISAILTKKFVRSSLLFWLILYALLMLLQYSASAPNDVWGYIQVTIGLPVIMLIFYVNFFLCTLYIVDHRAKYFLYSFLAFVLFLTAVYFIGRSEIADSQRQQKITHLVAAARLMLWFTLQYIALILISGFYWSVTYATKKSRENLKMEIRLQHMENEKVLAEKQFLQSQINPHFLYNTLNFFYAKSLTTSPELAESVLLLSDIMRYSLEQKENSSGLVALDDEIGHINNVIRINQFRFNHTLQIQFVVSGDTLRVRIVPLVLITLVENAFKHGDLLNTTFPVSIQLTADETKQKIIFTVRNKKKTGPKEKGTGIGLDNTKRRLAYTYGDGHTVTIADESEFYTASLELPLFKDV